MEKLTNLNFFDEVYYEINKLPDDLVHNIDVITIGFDTEYQQKSENERIILSYQASIALPYYEKYLNLIFITNNYQRITINQFFKISVYDCCNWAKTAWRFSRPAALISW